MGAGLLHLWEVDGDVVVADEQTDATTIQTSFACEKEGLGKVTLTVSKPSGLVSTVSSDIQCTGAYDTCETDRPPCESCIPDNPPEDKERS